MHDKSVLDDILNIISSSVGSLTNAGKIAKTFRSERQVNISDETVSRYLEFFVDAFMIYKADRYDVKGRKYIGSPLKYYFSDVGLRNARLNFRQQEENHIMENIILVVKDNIIPWHDENGILYVGIEKFLLDETAMEL